MNKKVKNSSKKTVKKTKVTKKNTNNKPIKKVETKKCGFNLDNAIYFMIGVIIIFGLCLLLGISFNTKWVREGNTISRGEEVYQIGDYYEYDETNGGKIDGLTDVKWQVMGVEDGALLLVSDKTVETLTLGSTSDLDEAKNDYLTGSEQMNEISEKYSHGKGAIGARSISNKDIIDVFGLNVGEKFKEKFTTYYWGSNSKVISIDERDDKNESDLYLDGKFHWFNISNNKWEVNENSDNSTDENPKKITESKIDLIVFNAEEYDENYYNNFDEDHNYIGEDKRVTMLFSKDLKEPVSYWTSDSFIFSQSTFIGYGYNVVKGFDLNYNYLVYSMGVSREVTFGVRPVVLIK